MKEAIRALEGEFDDEEGIPIPEPVPGEYSGRLVIRVPKSPPKRLAETAARENVSLNQYITYQLARSVGQRG